ncbi:hypothetical protein GQ42DRAFT_31257 [Ramicandelaber brevisporus]|nr:hypothetical protein GQ42DRAFT_31257 [Ramicandelaber brevisporus]
MCLPAKVWSKYGPLVRVAELGRYTDTETCGIWIPNVKKLTIRSSPVIETLFKLDSGGSSDQLLSLQKLNVAFESDLESELTRGLKIVDWARCAESRGQNTAVYWSILYSSSESGQLLDAIVGSAINPTQHSITLGMYDEQLGVSSSQFAMSKFATMLVELSIHAIPVLAHLHNQCGLFFGDCSVVYPRLESLSITQTHAHGDTHLISYDGIEGLDPSMLPALRQVRLSFADGQDNGFLTLLHQHKWMSVVDLELCSYKDAGLLEHTLNSFRNTKRLRLSE